MQSVYFGGSRNFNQASSPLPSVLNTVLKSGQSVHVGCQRGADQAVMVNMRHFSSSLFIFAVAPLLSLAPAHVQQAHKAGASVTFSAGGQVAPEPARYLLRSIKAFQGCNSAVFFMPGAGSLAVARECVRSGLQVFAFGSMPARVPSVSGQWVSASFMGFQCWQWAAPVQQVLF